MITLYNDDCLKAMNEIPDGSVDMVLCDLPYGITDAGWDNVIDYDELWSQYDRVVKENGAILLFASMPFAYDLIKSNRKMFRYQIVWVKSKPSGHLLAKKMPLRDHELILVFYKKQPTYNPQMQKAINKRGEVGRGKLQRHTNAGLYGGEKPTYLIETGERYPVDVVYYHAIVNGPNKVHPSQKPVDLLEYFIKTYSNDGDVILDNTMGSGSTGVACVRTGRGFIGIEMDADYYRIACERIEEEQNALKGVVVDAGVTYKQFNVFDITEDDYER